MAPTVTGEWQLLLGWPEMVNWSYCTGVRGKSRVRVYERYDDGPLQVDATGLPRQSLKKAFGVPVTNKEIAVLCAHRLSDRLEKGATGKTAADVLGLRAEPPEPLSQSELRRIAREVVQEHRAEQMKQD